MMDGSIYALKVVKLDDDDDMNSRDAIQAEINILLSIKGFNITLDIVDFEMQPDKALIVMELGDVDLKQFLKENPNMSEHKIASILEDMIQCLSKFHELGHIHADLKPQNFMFKKGKVKLIDFGISMQMKSGTTMAFRDTIIGTPKYIAPEVIKLNYGMPGGAIHRASDIWSLGVIIHEMVCGYSPFDELMK